MKGIKEFEKLNEMDLRQAKSIQKFISDIEQNREKLIRLYAQLVNNNKASWKIYNSILAEINLGRDNIYTDWKKRSTEADEEHLDLMNQINTLLKKEESIKANIDKKLKMFKK
jgi:hypothetical protein